MKYATGKEKEDGDDENGSKRCIWRRLGHFESSNGSASATTSILGPRDMLRLKPECFFSLIIYFKLQRLLYFKNSNYSTSTMRCYNVNNSLPVTLFYNSFLCLNFFT